MANGVELATAWIRLVPSVEGIQGAIAKEFGGASADADKEGEKAGARYGSGLKKALVGGAIVAGIVGTFKGLYDIGSTFDDVTDTIRVGTGAQGAALEGLASVAKEVGKSVPASFEAAGQTVADVNTRLGLSGKTLKTVASQYLEAGRILDTEIDIKGTSAAFSAFKIEGDAVSGAMDTLFRVSQATGVGMNELAAGIQAQAPALKNLGFGYEDSVALLGSLDKAGVNTQAVMASMSKGLVTLAEDGEEPQKAFRRVSSEIQGFIDKGDTASALNLASEIFGTRGASQFVGALQSGVMNMDDLMASTGATGDTILGVGGETQDFAEKWQITMNKATAAIEPLATAIFTGLGEGLTAIMPALQDIGDWVGGNTQVIAILAAVVGVTLVAAFIAWTASIWASTIALLANPVTWIILAIVALIAAVVLLVMNWDAVVAWLTDVWQGFVNWMVDVISGFVIWWNGVWTAFGDFIVGIWVGFIAWVNNLFQMFLLGLRVIGDAISSWWVGLWSAVGQFVADVWTGFISWVKHTFQMFLVGLQVVGSAIASWWNGLWSGIGSFVAFIWESIVGFVTGYINTVRSVITSVVGAVQKVWEDVWGGISTFFGNVWDGIVSVAKNSINGVIRLINGLVGGFNEVGSFLSDISGGAISVSIPKIPLLADGGTITRRGSAIVGEKGPELVTLPRGAEVNPDISSVRDGLVYYAAPNQSFDAEQDLRLAMDRREALV